MLSEGMIRMYSDNPTRGLTDGVEISESTQEFPLSVIVNTKEANHTIVKAALRCDSGFRTTGNTEISISGLNAGKWTVADDDHYLSEENADQLATFTSGLTISDSIGDTNHIVWFKVSTDGEEPAQVDTTVKIHVYGNTVPS